jgi:hypothetical protein
MNMDGDRRVTFRVFGPLMRKMAVCSGRSMRTVQPLLSYAPDFCKMEIRFILFKEIVSLISLNDQPNYYYVKHLPFRRKNHKEDSCFLK